MGGDGIDWVTLAEALRTRRHYGAQAAALERALENRPDDTEAWCERGIALWHLGRHDEALAAFDHALALDPTSGPA